MSSLNYQLPLNFFDQLVDSSKLGGRNYVRGFPELVQLVKSHLASPGNGHSAPSTIIFLGSGQQQMYASYGKSWKPGIRLLCFDATASGFAVLKVLAYNPLTGLLVFENQFQSTFYDAKATTWTLASAFSELVMTANTLAQGLTAANNVSSARGTLQEGVPKNAGAILFDDFIGKPAASWYVSTGVNHWQKPVNYTSSTDPVNHPGCAQISASAVGATQALSFNDARYADLLDLSGVGSAIEICFNLPTLSTSGQRYTIVSGLASSLDAAGPLAYFSYCDNVNSGNFTISYGAKNALTTANLSIGPVAGQWNVLRVERTTSNLLFTANNGSSLVNSSVATTGVTGTGVKRGTPLLQISKNVGSTNISAVCDYLYVRKILGGSR